MADKEVTKSATPAPAERGYYPLAGFRQEMDRLFDSFFPDIWGSAFPRLPRTTLSMPAAPRVDVSETDGAYVIAAEMPGMDEKDVQVELRDGILTIQGEKKAEREEKDKEYHLTERTYGSFRRSFQLPDSIDPEKISAEFDKGVLTINLAKLPQAEARSKKIEIKAK